MRTPYQIKCHISVTSTNTSGAVCREHMSSSKTNSLLGYLDTGIERAIYSG